MYDVIIIGSGYGGSVTAARLAGLGKVLVVERGKHWRSGDFPNGLTAFARSYRTRRNPLGLWEVRLGEGTGNAYVSGVGGASLCYYGITTRPDAHAFDGWAVSGSELDPYYQRALERLRPEPDPDADLYGDKQFLDHVEPGHRHDLTNMIDWQKCTRCGNCVTGCNVDAKRSLDRTYLADALAAGAERRAETEGVGLRPKKGGGWEVLARHTEHQGEPEAIPARHVILAGGTLGTLDLLYKERETLPLSPAFGRDVSMNGDGAAFLYNTRFPIGGHEGAPITTTVRLTHHVDGRPRTLTVMSGRVPKFIMHSSANLMNALAPVMGERYEAEGDPLGARASRRARDVTGVKKGGAFSQTFMYKLDGQDSARGQIRFDEDGRSSVDWADYANDPIMAFAAERLKVWAAKVGGTLLPDLGTWPGLRSFGVHPLGGCRMSTTWAGGVVDKRLRVRTVDGVYPGLRIVDGSVIPFSLGVPPSLTIAALAERAAEDLGRELKAG